MLVSSADLKMLMSGARIHLIMFRKRTLAASCQVDRPERVFVRHYGFSVKVKVLIRYACFVRNSLTSCLGVSPEAVLTVLDLWRPVSGHRKADPSAPFLSHSFPHTVMPSTALLYGWVVFFTVLCAVLPLLRFYALRRKTRTKSDYACDFFYLLAVVVVLAQSIFLATVIRAQMNLESTSLPLAQQHLELFTLPRVKVVFQMPLASIVHAAISI